MQRVFGRWVEIKVLVEAYGLLILGMHDQSWGGEYFFDDVAVHSLNPRKRAELRNRNVGFVFQSYHLLDDQTVFENLELPLSYRDVSKKDRQSIGRDRRRAMAQ